MYAYLLEKSVTWQQNPQMQYSKTNTALLEQPLFGANRVASGAQAEGPKKVTVQAEGINPQLRERISRLTGIILTDKEGDLLVKNGDHGGYILAQGNGRTLNRDELSADQLVERIRAEPAIRELIGLSYRNPGNEILLTTVGDNLPSGQTVFSKGDTMKFEVRSGKRAWFLLLDIDAEGTVTVVYPALEDPLDPVDARQPRILGKGGLATAPFGMEFLKLFAFEQKPAEYDSWHANDKERVKEFSPTSAEFQRLLAALKVQSQAAEIAVRIITKDR
jgi:hypothetical protein